MNVSTDMLTLPARVLPMPEIVYTDQYHVTSDTVRDVGTWQMKPTRFHTPANFPAVWGMINLSLINEHACEDFYNELSNIAGQRVRTRRVGPWGRHANDSTHKCCNWNKTK
ncbi:unnamed protein product [Rotaria magnacalcarata]|uniref:Uncharacterized protein n=1 Tax=Rotaria magnacalcarata TaxID=392030 RepID=A0A8S3G6F1_9BILA|nr:unnamed protein product [Rotaria magnacalcarata]